MPLNIGRVWWYILLNNVEPPSRHTASSKYILAKSAPVMKNMVVKKANRSVFLKSKDSN